MVEKSAHRNTSCKKCNIVMRPSKAIAQTFVGGTPDFIDDTHSSTFSAGGTGELIDCLKCPKCGWSMTAPKRQTGYSL